MNYSLIIIDMQKPFLNSLGTKATQSCKRLIRKAMKDNASIVFVEYKNYGKTIPELTGITNLVKYKNKHFVIKQDNDGSRVVGNTINKYKLPTVKLKIAGVNTDYCVIDTLSGLQKLLPTSKFEVIANACDSSYSHKDGLKDISKIKNVKIK